MAGQPPNQGSPPPPVDQDQLNIEKEAEKKRIREQLLQESQALGLPMARAVAFYPRQPQENEEQFAQRVIVHKQEFINSLDNSNPELKKAILSENETESSIIATKEGLVFTGTNGMAAMKEYLTSNPNATVKIFGKDKATAQAELLRYIDHGIDIHKVTEFTYQDETGKQVLIAGADLHNLKIAAYQSRGLEMPMPAATPTSTAVTTAQVSNVQASSAAPAPVSADVSPPSLGANVQVQPQAAAVTSLPADSMQSRPVEKITAGDTPKATAVDQPKTAVVTPQAKPEPFVDTPESQLMREIHHLKGVIDNAEWTVKERVAREDNARMRGEGQTYSNAYSTADRLADQQKIKADQDRLKQAEDELVALRAAKQEPKVAVEPKVAQEPKAAVEVRPQAQAVPDATPKAVAPTQAPAPAPEPQIKLNVTQASGPYLPNNVSVSGSSNIADGLAKPLAAFTALSTTASQMPLSPRAQAGVNNTMTPMFERDKAMDNQARKDAQTADQVLQDTATRRAMAAATPDATQDATQREKPGQSQRR